jgi:hypothetical protein
MQSAKLRNLNDSPATHYLPRNGTSLAQSQMRSRLMIVAEVSQYPLQMFAIQDHEVVQTFLADRTDQTFGV